MMNGGSVFQLFPGDNVATALSDLVPGVAAVKGAVGGSIEVLEEVTAGHKIALQDIRAGEAVIKYGVVIGEATADIRRGGWVHLYNMKSRYDERSSHLNVFTGAPDDTHYE